MRPGSFVEWKAQLPTDNSGEGDGLHTDLWCTVNGRTTIPNAPNPAGDDEVDVAEHVMGTSTTNHETMLGGVWDGSAQEVVDYSGYYAPHDADYTAGMHTFGLWWLTGGGSQGQMQLYVDGVALGSPTAINDSGWSGQTYCFGGWMQSSASWNGNNGSVLDSSTTNNDPFYVQYFRYWEAN